MMLAALQQALGADLAADLERIAWAQTIMAGATVLVALAVLGASVAALFLLRKLIRTAEEAQRAVKAYAPRVDPILERARSVADDVAHVSASVRDEVASLRKTVEELNRQVRSGIDATEERVREFGVVLDTVQQQTQDVLLDAAATARGLQATAEALQRRGRRREPRER